MTADTENKTTMSHCTAAPAELPENCLEKNPGFRKRAEQTGILEYCSCGLSDKRIKKKESGTNS